MAALMNLGALDRGAGGRPRRVVLAALLAALVAATGAPGADAKLRLTARSAPPETGGPFGRVPVRLDIRGDSSPHDLLVRSPGSLVAVGPGLQAQSAIGGRTTVACRGSWARPHLTSSPLAFTAIVHLEPGQSTWLQAVIDRWAPWPSDPAEAGWTVEDGAQTTVVPDPAPFSLPRGVHLVVRGPGGPVAAGDLVRVSGTADPLPRGELVSVDVHPPGGRALHTYTARVGARHRFTVAFRPRARGRYELVARYRRHTAEFADDASVCGSVFDVG
jgi:hypothetical protein